MALTSGWIETCPGAEKINTFPTTRIRNLQSLNATKDTIESRTHLKRSGSTRRNSEGSVLVLPVVFVFFGESVTVCFLVCSSHRYWRYVGQATHRDGLAKEDESHG